jgi:hypothetical protein
MTVYKISYVIMGVKHPGAIVNADHAPQIGEHIQLGDETFEVVEVVDLMPARGNFHYLHVTCRPIPAAPDLEKA